MTERIQRMELIDPAIAEPGSIGLSRRVHEDVRVALAAFPAVAPKDTVKTGCAGIAFIDEAVFQHYMAGRRLAGPAGE